MRLSIIISLHPSAFIYQSIHILTYFSLHSSTVHLPDIHCQLRHLAIYPAIHVSTCPSICVSIYLIFLYPSILLVIYTLFTHPPISQPIHLSPSLFIYLIPIMMEGCWERHEEEVLLVFARVPEMSRKKGCGLWSRA